MPIYRAITQPAEIVDHELGDGISPVTYLIDRRLKHVHLYTRETYGATDERAESSSNCRCWEKHALFRCERRRRHPVYTADIQIFCVRFFDELQDDLVEAVRICQ